MALSPNDRVLVSAHGRFVVDHRPGKEEVISDPVDLVRHLVHARLRSGVRHHLDSLRGDRAPEAELFRRLAQDVLLMTFDSLRAGKVREDERLASSVLGTCRRMAIGLARSATRRQRLLERFGGVYAGG